MNLVVILLSSVPLYILLNITVRVVDFGTTPSLFWSNCDSCFLIRYIQTRQLKRSSFIKFKVQLEKGPFNTVCAITSGRQTSAALILISFEFWTLISRTLDTSFSISLEGLFIFPYTFHWPVPITWHNLLLCYVMVCLLGTRRSHKCIYRVICKNPLTPSSVDILSSGLWNHILTDIKRL